MSEIVFINGRFVSPEQATVSIFDRGYLLGQGVFATMRGYDGVCFRPEAHLDEIARGAAMLGIRVPYSLSEIAAWSDEAAKRTNVQNAYVRVTLTSGVTDDKPTLSIIARPMNDIPSPEEYASGIAAITVARRRIPPACIDGTIKTTSYAAQVIARREVLSRGAAEGVQLAIDGSLACGTMSTLFIVSGDTLLTPSVQSGCRAGVTRNAILHDIAPGLNLTVREERLEPSIFYGRADEAFFASTRVECLPIASIDGKRVYRRLSTQPTFERTHAIRAAFTNLVREETKARRRQR